MAAGLAQTSNPARMTQVGSEVERSAKLTSMMSEKLSSLYARLQNVLRETSPEAPEDTASVKPTLVGHAMALSNHNDQLDRIDSGLADILDRLEL